MSKLRDIACAYGHYLGWAVLPLQARAKRPDGQLVPKGKDEATSDLRTILRWWERKPQANIGLNCETSGFIVLDVDPRNGGDDTLHELIADLGQLPITVEAHTGGGGQHILFRHPGVTLRGTLGEGLDIKDHGYIVAPPSIHPSGRRYEWSVDGEPGDVPLANLPERWLQAATQRRAATTRRVPMEPSSDELLRVPAAIYVPKLTGRPVVQGWVQCPFHRNGQERTPSFKAEGTLWACFGSCEPLPGKQVRGGNVLDLAALLWDYPYPLTGVDLLEVKARVAKMLDV